MSHRPLYGHWAIRRQLTAAAADGRLPASLLLQGPRGVGKQRLALWLGQFLLCERAVADRLEEPCGACQHCRYAERGMHPDLHWVFPRAKVKDSDPQPEDAREDLAEAIADRMKAEGLWGPSTGTEAIYKYMMQAVVQDSGRRPAMARRAVFVLGDAERMVPQESSPESANMLLKLLEEPPPGTTLILTSSEPGTLLPTIRSRVVSVRVPTLTVADLEAFLSDPVVERTLAQVPRDEVLARANGAPGNLFAGESMRSAFAAARQLLEAALAPATPDGTALRIKVAARQGVAGARGAFSDMLEALTHLLHARTKQLVHADRTADARRMAMTIPLVEKAKELTQRNVSPNLQTAALLRSIHRTLHP
ncbi:MAG: ATP-binding protein [Gemmatimonas sp.]|jgi:DNA polymerase-3 subunit delta'|uniref:DNA polymerase III subunit n=1 Tax=Gemmatimonas sp. TaxID=1962908 RepID=UPI00391F45B6|nr:hypothetical protein [Gemmatimonadota bacterium]